MNLQDQDSLSKARISAIIGRFSEPTDDDFHCFDKGIDVPTEIEYDLQVIRRIQNPVF